MEVQKQEFHRHEAQAELLMVYSDTQVLNFFFMDIPFWIGGTIQK